MPETKIKPQQAVGSYLNPPQGYMLNGQIVVTDSGSGLVVALKTLTGTGADPSASDPIIIRIGNSVRTVTAATSVTLADGTNWFNAGSAELATKEIDYFVYAVYDSNSSVVALGFARIAHGALVSDFSATTTNEKYIAGYSGFTTTDGVEVIGRFAATLSAGAGYTWSVPTFTAVNLIQRPIYTSRLLSWVPVMSYSGGGGSNLTPTVNEAFYVITGKQFHVIYDLSMNGSLSAGTGNPRVTLPITPYGSGAAPLSLSIFQDASDSYRNFPLIHAVATVYDTFYPCSPDTGAAAQAIAASDRVWQRALIDL